MKIFFAGVTSDLDPTTLIWRYWAVHAWQKWTFYIKVFRSQRQTDRQTDRPMQWNAFPHCLHGAVDNTCMNSIRVSLQANTMCLYCT